MKNSLIAYLFFLPLSVFIVSGLFLLGGSWDLNSIVDEARFDEMAVFAKDIVIQIIIKDLSDLGISFQNFVSEKSLYSSWDGHNYRQWCYSG
jgi:hypothetical protein